MISLLLTGILLAAGCSTTPPAPAAPGDSLSTPASPSFPPVPAREPVENAGLFVSICLVPDHALGDSITFSGTTNLPAGENITTRVFEARYKCTKCQRKNDSVEGCCGDQIPLAVPVRPGPGGVNTWSREVNTSAFDFGVGDYQIDVGEPSRGIGNSRGFTIREKSVPAGFWIAPDPIPVHHLGDTITFRGTTNLAPGELITLRITEPVVMCAKCRKSADSVNGCCGDFNRTVTVRPGPCDNNHWSLEVNTSEHDFRAENEYWIGMYGRDGQVENASFFTVSGMPRPNLTLNLPENDTGGSALRFSGRANTGNGPEEKLLLILSSDSGRSARFVVPVYRDGIFLEFYREQVRDCPV